MNPSLIALLSITFGIGGAHLYTHLSKNGMGHLWITSAGVFGSILCIKIVGRLGFDPTSIVSQDSHILLMMNLTFSLLGGVLGVILLRIFEEKMGETRQISHQEKH